MTSILICSQSISWRESASLVESFISNLEASFLMIIMHQEFFLDLSRIQKSPCLVIAIAAHDIEKNKVRGDIGITYDMDVLRLIDAFTNNGLYVGSVVLTQFAEQPSAVAYEKKLKIMDMTAFALCQDNKMSIYVYDANTKGNLLKVLNGEPIGTLLY